MTYVLRTDITLDRPLEPVWALFADAANLQPITPPELHFRILTPMPIAMKRGTHIDYRIRLFGVPFHWKTEITCWQPGVRFVDEQIEGPFRRWTHEHVFERVDEGTTRIRDEVRYALPFGRLGRLAHPLVRRRLDRIFDYRETRVRELLSTGRTDRAAARGARDGDAAGIGPGSSGDAGATPLPAAPARPASPTRPASPARPASPGALRRVPSGRRDRQEEAGA